MSVSATDVVRVLTVEDDIDEAKLTRRFLEKRIGARVDIASDPATARRKLSVGDYDVVLVDTVDADDPEFKLLEEIAALDKGFAVVVVTGQGDERLAAKALEVGATGYVIKDQHMPDALIAAIENALMNMSLRRAQALFDTQQAITEAALAALNQIFMAVDMHGVFIKWNKQLCAVTGYDDDEICELHLCDILDPTEIGRVKEQVLEAVSDAALTFEMTIVARSGKRRSFEVCTRAFRKPGGEPEGVFFLGRDITDAKRKSELLTRANEELDDFAQAVSHDLKRPLAAMMLAAETLKLILSTPCSPTSERPVGIVNEMTDIISDECMKASEMISSMLQLAEDAQVPSSISSVDVEAVVRRVVDELGEASTAEPPDVRIEDNLGRVKGDETQLYRLFANLIGNAVQHCEADSLIVEVLAISAEKGYKGFVVRDNGKGIAEDLMPHIFKPFFTGDGGGTGIGLTSARKIVKMSGGEIRAYNDNGACFEFTLPQ